MQCVESQPLKISDDLAEFLGKEPGSEMTELNAVGLIHEYAKSNNLLCNNNRCTIKYKMDYKLARLFYLTLSDTLNHSKIDDYLYIYNHLILPESCDKLYGEIGRTGKFAYIIAYKYGSSEYPDLTGKETVYLDKHECLVQLLILIRKYIVDDYDDFESELSNLIAMRIVTIIDSLVINASDDDSSASDDDSSASDNDSSASKDEFGTNKKYDGKPIDMNRLNAACNNIMRLNYDEWLVPIRLVVLRLDSD